MSENEDMNLRFIERMVKSGFMTDEKAAEMRRKFTALKGEPSFERNVANAFQEALSLLLQKHQDYGPKNIADAPGGPLNGLRVRMYDKLARINNLVESGAEPENESLRDSFMDLANYGIIGLLVLDGHWPGEGSR